MAEVFATGFVGGTSPPVIGPNDILSQGPDAILVADGHDVWRISRVGSSPTVMGLTLRTGLVAGCKSVTGSIALTGRAPAEGLLVSLSDTLEAATVPATLKVPAGATCRNFVVRTQPVAAEETGTVSATVGATTVDDELTLRPMRLSGIALKPTSIVGGHTALGKATLECNAGPGPVEVQLSTSDAAIAAPVASSVFVPQGLRAVTFDIATNPVLTRSKAKLSGMANGGTRSKTLTVTPAASVSPRSLKFGNQLVGTTSPVVGAILTNNGVTAIAVDDIAITGTYASWFAHSHNCPAVLPAGATCSFGVTFTPLAAASRSARLTIATSATEIPLRVSLSGTGIL